MMNPLALWSVMGVVAGSGAPAFEGETVSEVTLVMEGQREAPPATHSLVEVRTGDLYRASAVRRSIKQLFALGSFSDIKAEAESQENGVALTFRLYPIARVQEVRLLNAEHRRGPREDDAWSELREALMEVTEIQPGELVDVERVEGVADGLVDRALREGFFWARVEPEIRYLADDAVVLFHCEPGPRARVAHLRIEGAREHVARQLRNELSVREENPYVPHVFDAHLDRLVSEWRQRGFFLARAEATESLLSPGWVDVTVRVDVGPRVIVDVTGADLTGHRRDRLLTVSREASLSPDLVEESRANLEEHFHGEGYPDAKVTVEQTTVGNGLYRVLEFAVELGRRFEVGSVRVEGASRAQQAEILALLHTRPRGRFRSAPFQKNTWEDDLNQVRAHLREHGYYDAEVSDRIEERGERTGIVDLIVIVKQGRRSFIESIQIEGASQIPSQQVLAASGLTAGSVLDSARVIEARRRVVNLYRDRGFRRADVQSHVALDESTDLASVFFRIEEGPQTMVDRIIISGLDVTREEIVRREVVLSSDAPLSSLDLFETRQRLVSTGIFRDVNIEVLPTDPATRSSDVLITLEEGPRTSVGYGVGYNEREKGRVEAEITRRNLFGLNRTASLFGRVSFGGNRVITTFRQPETFGYDLPAFVTGFFEEQVRTGFSFNRLGFALQFSRKVSDSSTLFFRYRFDRNKTFDVEIDPNALDRRFRNFRIGSVSVSSVTDSRDDPIDPSRGQFRLLDLEWSTRFLGTQSPYLKGLAQQFVYFPLGRGLVGVVGLRVGVGQTFREDRDALLPITERFFAGGATTLRGFGLDMASPMDVNGNPAGGNILTLLNLELRLPILNKLGAVVFSDNGNVYRRLQVIELLNWRYNVGFGIRYETPLGPVRVDYGVNVDRRPDEPAGRWHVSLGQAF